MRRPARVRNSPGIHGYVVAPDLAWAGWRLSIPGGPDGGQYHGYTGDDSGDSDAEPVALSGVDPLIWGGTALQEGQTLSDYVYRSPSEVRPRSNASGGANSFSEFQTKRTPGYAIAPGNYSALGLTAIDNRISSELLPVRSVAMLPTRTTRLSPTSPPIGWPAAATEPTAPLPPITLCPTYQLACPTGSVVQYGNDSCHTPIGCGPVNTVAQPSPGVPQTPNTVVVTTTPPVSPSPAPTVAASPDDYLPATGQPLPATTTVSATTTAATTSSGVDIGAWLSSSSIWSAVPNWVLVAGGALLLFSSRGGKK